MLRILNFLFFLLCSAAVGSQVPYDLPEARARLTRAGGVWQTNGAGYFSVRFASPLTYPAAKVELSARAFLAEHVRALGPDGPEDLRLARSNRGHDGNHYLRYQQLRSGVAVLGGELTLAVGPDGAVRTATGSLLAKSDFAPAAAPPNPSPSAGDFRRQAIAALLDRYPFAHQWNVEEKAPAWVNQHPWNPGPADPAHLTRVFEVAEPGDHRRLRVYLDAATAKHVFDHQLHCDLNRKLYRRYVADFNVLWGENDAFPGSLNAERQEMLVATAETHHLLSRTFGRKSYDDADGRMDAVTETTFNNNANDNFGCPNARAGTNSIRNCTGVVTDDIVAHEWMHVYTFNMNGLIYGYESGAVNEAFSDIFGECIDLLNGRGNDTNDQQPRQSCDGNNLRWQIGEDAPALDGTLRDLWLPECKDDASSRDSPNFLCSSEAKEGVHTNSGLVNRTFTLLTDGGVVSEDTITGIGMTKALHIFYHAHANYVTRVTDFHALGDMLMLAARDLRGVDLPALTLVDLPAAFSGEVIDSADVAQLANTIRITQLRGEGPCETAPVLARNPPDVCATALLPNLLPLLDQSWEDSLGAWSVTSFSAVDSTREATSWRVDGNLPDGRAGLGVFASSPDAENCRTTPDNGLASITSPIIRLPVGESDFRLAFDHYFALQEERDGGLLYLSTDGGDFAMVPDSAFLFNGYNGRLRVGNRNDNPLSGARAFTGSDKSSTSGSWGRSIIDLAAAGAYEGAEIRVRWTLGHDGCEGWLGWYLDEVRVGYCGELALPVEWLRFTGTPAKDRVVLEWSTARESGNAGFFAERRNASGGQFQDVGFVGADPSGVYSLADLGVVPGATYVYRLRQRDVDGTESYSNLLTVTLPAGNELRVFPNPARNQLTISNGTSAGTARLFNGHGRLITSVNLNRGTGRLSTGHLPTGVYFLRVGPVTRQIVLTR